MPEPIMLPELELVRNTIAAVEFRAGDDEADSDDLGVMEVRYSVPNTWYRISSFWEGDFIERTAPGAFKKTIDSHNRASNKDAHNIKTLFNHGMDFHIGDKLLGSIARAEEDKSGPVHEVNLFDTSYNRDLLPGLRAGVYGSSFMFRVIADEWNNEPGTSDHNPDGVPERTLKEVRVFEAGPVTFPANPAATSGMRCSSGTDAYYEHLARRDPMRVDGMRSRLTALRSAKVAPAGTGTDPGAAIDGRNEPASGHSGRAQREITLARLARRERLARL
jgi:HK97 family phage prohead protease